MNSRITLQLIVFSMLLPAGVRAQGSLTPPAGPPAPVMKSLQEVYDRAAAAEARIPVNAETCPASADAQFVITQGGSYYLTGNIAAPSGKAAIKLFAHGITLDLNGYSIIGSVGSTKGIIVASAGGSAVVRNGHVRVAQQQAIQFTAASDFVLQDISIFSAGGRGIDALGGGMIERVSVKGAKDYGIYCDGSQQVTVRECKVESVTGTGITMGIYAPNALVSRCSVTGVTGGSAGGGSVAGISADKGTVESCTVRNIVRNGSNSRLAGIENAATVTDCTVTDITGNGPASPESALEAAGIYACSNVSRCSVRSVNGGAGQHGEGIGLASNVSHCYVSDIRGSLDNAGIAGVRISDCTVYGVAGGHGIEGRLVQGCTVTDCAWGIFVIHVNATGGGEAGTATGNTVMDCTGIGIIAGTKMAVISNNHVHGDLSNPGSTGIYVSGVFSSRIEGNHVTRWETGISAPASANIVVRNTASSNTTDFNIPAAMPVAPVTAIGSHPNANIYNP